MSNEKIDPEFAEALRLLRSLTTQLEEQKKLLDEAQAVIAGVKIHSDNQDRLLTEAKALMDDINKQREDLAALVRRLLPRVAPGDTVAEHARDYLTRKGLMDAMRSN